MIVISVNYLLCNSTMAYLACTCPHALPRARAPVRGKKKEEVAQLLIFTRYAIVIATVIVIIIVCDRPYVRAFILEQNTKGIPTRAPYPPANSKPTPKRGAEAAQKQRRSHPRRVA